MNIILGGGLAGLSTAYHLKKDYLLFEKEADFCGLCRSKKEKGFIFDYGIHVLHTKNKEVLNFLRKINFLNKLTSQVHNVWICSHGAYTKYPFQLNTYGLPIPIVKECLLEFIKIKNKPDKKKPRNYEEWLYTMFGQGIARQFMLPYCKKMWTVEARHLDLDWVNVRVPQATIEEILDGALSVQKKEFGVNAVFQYPKTSGIQALPEAIINKLKRSNLRNRWEATKININSKIVSFKNGKTVKYENLISTLPLPEIIKIIDSKIPAKVLRALNFLKYTSIFCVNLSIDRKDLSDKHWLYFLEDKYPFFRISFPHNFSNHLVSKGLSSIQAEISYSKYKKINKKTIVRETIAALIKEGIINKNDKIVFQDSIDIKYAYVLYTFRRKENVKIVKDFLRKYSIFACGRFGDWEYHWMDNAILSGKKAAMAIIK